MTFVEGARIGFIVILGLSIVSNVAVLIEFRSRRNLVEKQIGPLPTPMGYLPIIFLLILLTGIGNLDAVSSTGWVIVSGLGIALTLYSLGLLAWTVRTLGRLAAPGPAVFTDHELITTGPFHLVRHPGYAAVQVLALGIALGTLNWLILAMWPVLLAATYFNARAEEQLLSEKFGPAYEEYARQKNRFIPGVGSSRQQTPIADS